MQPQLVAFKSAASQAHEKKLSASKKPVLVTRIVELKLEFLAIEKETDPSKLQERAVQLLTEHHKLFNHCYPSENTEQAKAKLVEQISRIKKMSMEILKPHLRRIIIQLHDLYNIANHPSHSSARIIERYEIPDSSTVTPAQVQKAFANITKCKKTFPNGDHFEGEVKDRNAWNGKGKLSDSNGHKFVGEWREGRFWEGEGKWTYPNGDRFEGFWNMGGYWNGIGKRTDANGNYFEGEFKEGQRWNGNGKKAFTNGEYFIGDWKNGEMWDGDVKCTTPLGNTFEGKFQNNQKWKGKLTSPNGNYFEGEWKELLFWNGIGKWTYPTGTHFEGEWKDFKFWDGVATGKLPNGDQLVVVWKEGNKITPSVTP